MAPTAHARGAHLVKDLGVQGLGFRVEGLGFRV
jgi:hypothetical protein